MIWDCQGLTKKKYSSIVNQLGFYVVQISGASGMRKFARKLFSVVLIVIIVGSPYLLFRNVKKYSPIVVTVWMLLAVTYVFTRRQNR